MTRADGYQGWLERDEQLAHTAERRQARLENAGEFPTVDPDPSTPRHDYQENWVEMTEFRIPPERAEQMQIELDLSAGVA
jgi:hypothetical protein